MMPSLNKYLPLITLFTMLCWAYFMIWGFKIHDFGNYYFGAVNWMQDFMGKDLFHPGKFNHWIHDQFHVNVFASYSPSPPSTFLIFIPFTVFSPLAAKLLWVTLNTMAGIWAFRRLQQITKASWKIWIISLIICFSAFRYELLFGQLYLFLLFLLIEGYVNFRNNRLWVAGTLWSIAILLKLFPLILFGFLLFKGEWKTLWRTFLVLVILTIGAVWMTGFEMWEFYVANILKKSNLGFVNTAFNEFLQSPISCFNHLFLFDALSNNAPFINAPAIIPILKALFYGSLFGIVIYLTRKSVFTYLQDFSLWLFLGLLLSPAGSTYAMLLIAPFLFSFISGSENKKIKITIGTLLLLSINLPLLWISKLPVLFQFPRLYFLLIVFGIITIKHLSRKVFYVVGVCCIFFLIPGFLQQNLIDNAEYVLKNDPAVITDYHTQNDILHYQFVDEQGLKQKETNIELRLNSSENVKISNDQVFYKGRQITFGNDAKWLAKLSNDGYIYYLSDYRRGYGFCTLRKIKSY